MRTSLLLCAAVLSAATAYAQPANDDCAGAETLTVFQIGQCPGQGSNGDNVDATQSGLPTCGATSTFFKDVWFTFNSGVNTEITADVVFFTIDEWGIELLDGCGGNSLFCDSTSSGQYVLSVAPGTDHWIRFFTNASTGSGGLFTICLSGNNIVSACDGGDIITDMGLSTVNVCQDGVADVIGFGSSTTSSEAFTFALTDYGGRIEFLFIDPFDFDTLPLAEYHVYGISYNGTLVGAVAGEDILLVTSTGSCVDVSDNDARVFVELCSAVEPVTGMNGWTLLGNGSGEPMRIIAPMDLPSARLTMIDATGREVAADVVSFAKGEPTALPFLGASGAYRVVLHWPNGRHAIPVVVR